MHKTSTEQVNGVQNKAVSERDWLERIGRSDYPMELSAYGYSDHPFQAVPINDRTLPVHLLWLVVDLGFSGQVEGTHIELEAGSFLWIRPGVPHSFTIPQGLRTYRVRIDLRDRDIPLTIEEPWLLVRNAWELRAPWEELLRELEVEEEHHYHRLRQLTGSICLLAFRHSKVADTAAVLSTQQRQKIQQLSVESFSKGLKPSDFARELTLSPAYFSRLFKQTFGLSPRAWIMRERLKQAATLLSETDQRISCISDACGFSNPNLFSRQFRKVYRVSPREYRNH